MRDLGQKTRDIFRKKYVQYGLKGGGVLFLLYFVWHASFWLDYSLKVNWHGMAQFSGPVVYAINRSLLLGETHIDQPVAGGLGVGRMCSEEEVLSGDKIYYAQCYITRGGASDRCGMLLIYNPECRSLSVTRELWENEDIRKRIIHAALHPCDFLINMKEKDEEAFVQKIRQSPDLYGYEGWNVRVHNELWEEAGCEGGGVNIVFFEIYNDDQLLSRKETDLLKVYKAYRKNGKIGGKYVRL